MTESHPTNLQQGNEWLKPVDPNEGERKWAQYVAATTPPRRSGTNSAGTTPQASSSPPLSSPGFGPAPAAIDVMVPAAPRPVSSNTPPVSPSTSALSISEKKADSSPGPQLYAQIDGRLVRVTLGSDGLILPVKPANTTKARSTSPAFEFDSDCDEKAIPEVGQQRTQISWNVTAPQNTWTAQGVSPSSQVIAPSPNFESQNAWILLQQQQQLLFQLQQQQAVTAATLAGIAAKSHLQPQTPDLAWMFASGTPSAKPVQDSASDGSANIFPPSDSGLSGQASATVTPTVACDAKPRNTRQEALMHQLRSTTITLPPPPPPPAPEKPFSHTKKKSKSHSLEALMNSLQYTDLLTPTYSSKEQTQSETGVVIETLDDEQSETNPGSSAATPSGIAFAPGYKKKQCRAFFSASGCKHGEKCLFSHASPASS